MQIGTLDWVLLAIAGFLAMTTLVRLMRNRQEFILDELTWQAELERRRKALQKKAEERRKVLEKLNQRAG